MKSGKKPPKELMSPYQANNIGRVFTYYDGVTPYPKRIPLSTIVTNFLNPRTGQ